MWLNPVALASSLGFKPAELRDIERLVSDNRAMPAKAWGEFHGKSWGACDECEFYL
jgi:hypothetical protein